MSETTPPQKYSRYRSVRNQAEIAGAAALAVPSPALNNAQDGDKTTVSRSMSRYRRPQKKNGPTTSPPMPNSPLPRANPVPSPTKPSIGTRRVTDPTRTPEREQVPSRHPTVAGNRPFARQRETEEERQIRKAKEREAEYQRRKQEAQEVTKAESPEDQAGRAEEEAIRILAEQKRKDLERLEATLEAATKARTVSPEREKFTFFSRKRAATKTSTTTTETRNTSLTTTLSKNSASPPGQSNEFRAQGKVEVGGIGPGTDAPISASNAGERRVLIRFKQSSINLPITPETTASDLVYSAANVLSQDINPLATVLLESYTQLGLDRRIRRYEHIRDIMNSWDRDTQNALVLQDSDSPKSDLDLESSSAPRNAPKDITVFLYHSQKPGKWSKRYVTLLSSGQIFMSKKNEAKLGEKDSVSLCHLSDFDIYHPTPQQVRKNLRPPKKHCHAIKSQQRTNMFLSTENFVHFFSTDMEEIAAIWYKAVQSWRSWYLVNKMGEGKNQTKANTVELAVQSQKRPGTKASPSHKVQVSVDENPYTIGSFKPLIDLARFTPKTDPDPECDGDGQPRQVPFHLRNGASPPKSEAKRHYPPPVSYRLPPEAEAEFSQSGLLGRTYSNRQQSAREREIAEKNADSPFVERSGAGHRRTNSMKSTRSSTQTIKRPTTSAGPGLQRNATTKEKPKPLLDFTPQFKEPPQWDKTGKGHGVQAVKGMLLVDVATTPENPLDEIPKASASVFRRPTTSHPATSRGEGPFVQGGLVSK